MRNLAKIQTTQEILCIGNYGKKYRLQHLLWQHPTHTVGVTNWESDVGVLPLSVAMVITDVFQIN
jgi:hypothetical protein